MEATNKTQTRTKALDRQSPEELRAHEHELCADQRRDPAVVAVLRGQRDVAHQPRPATHMRFENERATKQQTHPF